MLPTLVILTWTFIPYTGISTANTVDAASRAFSQWQQIAPIEFQYVPYSTSTHADIVISFQSGDHNDGWAFINRSNIAHTFGPGNPKPWLYQIHLNTEENWEQDTPSVYSVLLHEIGHLFGLPHTSCSQSVMQAFYRPWSYLYPYDVASIEGLWGLMIPKSTLPLLPSPSASL